MVDRSLDVRKIERGLCEVFGGTNLSSSDLRKLHCGGIEVQ